MMSSKLLRLLKRARKHLSTPEELEAQRQSFAYGNVKLHNPSITREQVAYISSTMERTQEERSMPQRPVA